MQFHGFAVAATVASLLAASGAQAVTFTFAETSQGVTMTSSGSIDVSGLVQERARSTWGGTGIEQNRYHDIMGGTSFGQIDTSYSFNAGTDFSALEAAAGPWTGSAFSWEVTAGAKSFATYVRVNGRQTPGLGIVAGDLDGTVWTADQAWLARGADFASLGLNAGVYAVSDALSGETISVVVGSFVAGANGGPSIVDPDPVSAVPVPASLPLVLAALGGFAALRRMR